MINCKLSRRIESLETRIVATRIPPFAARILLVNPERGLTGVLLLETETDHVRSGNA